MLKLTNNNKGFTLVEVLTSFAVLAIISVALLQMFVVSTKTNSIAYNRDKANALCTDMAESFKQNPDYVNLPAYHFTSTVNTTTGGILYTKYYSKAWADSGSSADEFRLDIDITTTHAIEMEKSYHPEFIGAGTLQVGTIHYLDISTSGAISLDGFGLNPGTGTIQYGTGTASIPVGINCSSLTGTANILHVNNRAEMTYSGSAVTAVADVYLCDIPIGASISLHAETGYSNENKISTGKIQTVDYNAVIGIIRRSDNSILARNTVTKRFSR
jgi:prepilin-type N-terminal cleavage/methylation domain-containing protein